MANLNERIPPGRAPKDPRDEDLDGRNPEQQREHQDHLEFNQKLGENFAADEQMYKDALERAKRLNLPDVEFLQEIVNRIEGSKTKGK